MRGSIRVEPFGASSNLRNGTVTASRAPEILGLGYSSRYKTMRILSGARDEEEKTGSFVQNAMAHGRKYESDAAKVFLQLFKSRYLPVGNSKDQYTYRGTFGNFHLACTPDLLLFNKLTQKIELLEIKCPYLSFCKQEPLGLPRPKHFIQCQVQMAVLGIDSAYLMLYVPDADGGTSSNYSIWKIEKDEQFQKFILSNVQQAMAELSDDQALWKMMRNEKAYNLQICMDCMGRSIKSVFF